MISEIVLEKLEYQKVLNHIASYCTTELGTSSLQNLKPFANQEMAELRGNYACEAKDILINFDYPPLSYLPDLQRVLTQSRIQGTILKKDEIRKTLELAQSSRKVYSFLKTNAESSNLYKNYRDNYFIDKNFESLISRVFNESGEISDNASTKLADIRKEIITKSSYLTKIVEKLLKDLSNSYLVQDEYVTQRDGRLVLPIKAEHKRHIKGFIHSESNTGQTVYIEPEQTLELNNEILSLTFAEKREIERILKEITIVIGNASYELQNAYSTLTDLDIIFAIAKYSMEILGSFPRINTNRLIKIIDARHPILLKKLGIEKTIPLNFNFENNNVTLITGPNAGGKTVVLKTIGLISLLVQTGIHVPVHPDSDFIFFDNVMLDIGDEQSLEDDLSTFSSHLTNIKNILQQANKNSLILIDEIGTGTDPTEGTALATAFLIKMVELESMVVATTHHGNLKIIASELDHFQNASMEYDIENFSPTYKFRQGMPGSSYAFEVAYKIGLDKETINLAKEYLDPDKNKVETFIIELENKSLELTKRLNQLEIENTRLSGLTSLYERENNKLKEQKESIIKETKHKAEKFLNDINSQFENTIKRIVESNAEKKVIKEEKKKIDNIKSAIETNYNLPLQKITPKESFILGDYVKLEESTTSGEIIEIDDDKKIATINTGSLRIKVKLKSIVHTQRKKEKLKDVFSFSQSDFGSSLLDIRGRRPEEIEFELIKYIDEASLANLKNIEIIHGKGTGALRETVHIILKEHELVKSFELATEEFGGAGATLVMLK